MTDDAVLTRREGPAGVMTFNRPDKLNTLDMPMMAAIGRAFDELASDPAVRCIVITGCDDRSFMAGGDVNDLAARRPTSWYDEFGTTVHRLFRRIETCDKPTIAAVNGWALGGGMELMLCTDLRLIAHEARIGLPEIRLGIFPGGGGTQRLTRQVSPVQAKFMMFTGDSIGAEQALALGLVNEVAPRAELMTRALALAERVAAMSAQTLKLLKRTIDQGAQMSIEPALAYELAMLSVAMDHPDAQEGCNAFLEKREPKYQGR